MRKENKNKLSGFSEDQKQEIREIVTEIVNEAIEKFSFMLFGVLNKSFTAIELNISDFKEETRQNFARIDKKFEEVDQKFERVEENFVQVRRDISNQGERFVSQQTFYDEKLRVTSILELHDKQLNKHSKKKM